MNENIKAETGGHTTTHESVDFHFLDQISIATVLIFNETDNRPRDYIHFSSQNLQMIHSARTVPCRQV